MARQKTRSIEIEFRGMDVTIRYEDGGYEEEVNAHSLDWWFDDDSLNKLTLTAEEEETIIQAIDDALNDDGYRD